MLRFCVKKESWWWIKRKYLRLSLQNKTPHPNPLPQGERGSEKGTPILIPSPLAGEG
jgi:hypothetical protein